METTTAEDEHLRQELARLRQRVAELETAAEEYERAELTLRRSEAYFRSLIENASDIIAILTQDGIFRYASPSHVRAMGYQPEEIIGQNVFSFIHPEDLPAVLETFQRGIRNPGIVLSVELRFRHRDGSWRILESVGHNLLHDPVVGGIVVNSRDITDRRQTEAALRQSEERYRQLVELSPDAIAIYRGGKIIFVNTAGARLMGAASPEELLGRSVLDFVHPEYRGLVVERMRRLVQEGVAVPLLEEKFLRVDGTTIDVEVAATPFHYGDTPAVQFIVRDITDRKRVQEALRESEERFRQIAENSRDVFWMSTPQNAETIYVSPAYERIWGRSCASAYARPQSFLDAVHPDHRDQVIAAVRSQSQEDFAGFEHEYRIVQPDGSIRWVLDRAFPIRNDRGQVYRIAGIASDITERKLAEEALRESETRLRTIVESLGEGLIITDEQDVIVFANSRMEELSGYSSADMVGQPAYYLLLPPEEWPALHARNQRRLQGTTERYETQLRRKDGSRFWTEIHATPFRNAAGAIIGTLGAHIDITARKQVEEAQARLAAILEATTDYVVTTDTAGQLLYVNAALRRALGIPDQEPLSHTVISNYFPDQAKLMILGQVIPAALRDGSWSGETAFVHRDGRPIPVSLVSLAHKRPDGTVDFLSYIARDIGERKRFEEQLAYLANHDPLTDLYNRRRFQEEVETQLAHARRFGVRGALFFLDLDYFKQVNDQWGHQAGDELLRNLALLLRERLRETDALARLGGDEFAIMALYADADQAQGIAERLLDALRQQPVLAAQERVSVTASIGIALFPDHGLTSSELLAHADLAMYRAKEQGRNRYRLYTPDMLTPNAPPRPR